MNVKSVDFFSGLKAIIGFVARKAFNYLTDLLFNNAAFNTLTCCSNNNSLMRNTSTSLYHRWISLGIVTICSRRTLIFKEMHLDVYMNTYVTKKGRSYDMCSVRLIHIYIYDSTRKKEEKKKQSAK